MTFIFHCRPDDLQVQPNNPPSDSTPSQAALLSALEVGNFEDVFKLLPVNDILPLRVGPDQLTPVHYACQHDRLDVLQKLVNEFGYDLHLLSETVPTPLQVASACGCVNIVQYLLGFGPDLSMKGGVVGPLHLAADNGHLDTLKALVESKICRVSISDHDGNTPLHHACAHGHLPVVTYLCDAAKHPLSVRNKKGETILHIAAKHCQFEIVKYLIDEKSCDPASKDGRVGSTPLHLAAKSGSLEIVQYLANEKTCNIESKTYQNRKRAMSVSSGRTPLHYACFGGHVEVVSYLVNEQICNPRSTDDDGLTPFHLACQEGHEDIVRFFVELNMSELNEMKTEDGRTPLHCAALSGNIKIVKQLVNATSCNVEAIDTQGRTAVHYASRNGCTNIVQMLVEEKKSNINAADQTGITPLHQAAQFGHVDTVKYLLGNPLCNPSCSDENGYTPLHLAAYKGRLDVVQVMVDERLINVMCRDKSGRTPLHHAAQTGSLEMVKLLASHPDCEPSCQDKGLKATPLHLASGSGHLNIVRYLVEEKTSNPACTDKFNSTPMHRAAASGQLKIVKYLVQEKQCSSISKNKFGNSPLHLACQKGQVEMVKLLLSYSKENITSRNQVGRMPLDLTNNLHILGEFLRLGVDPSKGSISTRYPYLKHWNALSPAVKIFILGDTGVGKTTIVKALQGEGFLTEWVSGRFQRVGAANTETVGINVTTFESRHFGKVVLYDLSGHPGYYAGHSTILNLACQESTPTFITMVDLRKSPDEIEHFIAYWSRFAKMSLPDKSLQPCGILVGSHDDELTKDGYRHKPAILEKAIMSQSKILQYVGWLTIDCRRAASTNMHKLRQLLSQRCEDVRSQYKPSHECCLLRSFILHKFQNPIVIEFRELEEYISHADIPDIKQPDTLFHTCEMLHSRGYILFLKDQQVRDNSWIILNQQAVLSMIHGFQKKVELPNKVGLLPISQLESTLGVLGFNLTLVIQYFLRVHFCIKVVDRRVLYSVMGFDPPSPPEDYLFFPHLITGDIQHDLWSNASNWEKYFGWIVECAEPGCFFNPRFLQMLLLRLAAVFPFNTNPNSSFITRRQMTYVWKNGISWTDTRGMQVLVELVQESTAVVVLTRYSKEASCELLYYQLRSLVLKEVRSIKEEICPCAAVKESVLLPESVTQYPLPSTTNADSVAAPPMAYRMADVARAILSPGVNHVKFATRLFSLNSLQDDDLSSTVAIDTLLQFELYRSLNKDTILQLVSEQNTNEEISEEVMERIATDLCRNEFEPSQLAKILQVAPAAIDNLQNASNRFATARYVSVLKRWALREDKGTHRALKDAFDQYSVFAGFNLVSLVVNDSGFLLKGLGGRGGGGGLLPLVCLFFGCG